MLRQYWMSQNQRSIQQNKLYHTLCSQLKSLSTVIIYDGRFELHGYPNPFCINPRPLSYDTFRELLKAVDWEYIKDKQGRPLSSTKLSVEQINSHITFLECLLMEIK
jgi:hypothetical protein